MLLAMPLCLWMAAQGFHPTADPVSAFLRETAVRSSHNLEGAAEVMPADKYAFRPTEGQMTFGDLVAHVVQTNFALCSAVSGKPSPMSPEELRQVTGKGAKQDLTRQLTQSFDYCRDALASGSDSQLSAETAMFGRPTGQSRAATLVTLAMDWADHYSTAAGYLRLNGILPPTAQPKKK